ncbi:uncharacterized protein LOC142320434 isoform X1 [Lycorma delicatula]|uniref:uncharacterized protein LOC142320434 isoform X1 n=1 Tax=Lycorma delicatula TaxID=130591 RepID=UPI003F50F990
MNEPVNNSFNNEALPLSKSIKLENEPDNVGNMICIFLPNHRTGTNTSFDHQKDLMRLKEEPLDINSDIPKDPLAIEDTNLVKSENVKVENEEIMNVPVNNTFTNEAVLLNKNIKLVTEQDNAVQMIWLLLPVTETNTSHEHQVDLVQLKQEPVDTINGDIPKDPLAIEETNSVKSKTVKVENEVESEKVLPQLNLNMKTDELEINYLHTVKTEEEVEFYPDHQVDLLQLEEELLDVSNSDIEKDPLAIEETDLVKSENLKVENKAQEDLLQLEEVLLDISNGDIEKDILAIEETNLVDNEVVTIDKGNIKGSTNVSNECKCAYGDITTEENLVQNLSSENMLFFQKGKNLVCEYCDEGFQCKCYLKRHINFHCKNKKIVIFVKSLLFMITI